LTNARFGLNSLGSSGPVAVSTRNDRGEEPTNAVPVISRSPDIKSAAKARAPADPSLA